MIVIHKGIQPLLREIMKQSAEGQALLNRIVSYPWYKMWETGASDKEGMNPVIKYHLILSDSFVCHNIRLYEIEVSNQGHSTQSIFTELLDKINKDPL